ncbi:MAG: DUF427 domain-containing protein [Frankiales bacterium]|nr:DUF427 domain-containing protein [Frankiales bacterium]
MKRETPGPGQESVWDYPRPPRLERSERLVTVVLGGVEVCRTTRAWRVLETSHPPSWYLPREDWLEGSLEPAAGSSLCEWKGLASYLDVVGGGKRAARAGWTYLDPTPLFAGLAGAVALYPAAVDLCAIDGEVVRAQEGGFYGGWVTDDVVGPFKGAPGTLGW